MTVWFVSRHPGALEWMCRHDIVFDCHVPHLTMEEIRAGDAVIGSLPVNLAAEVCARGAIYRHLSLQLIPHDRGRELSADDLDRYEATLTNYLVKDIS
jgi:CRISPR-associated protein Csx16